MDVIAIIYIVVFLGTLVLGLYTAGRLLFKKMGDYLSYRKKRK